MRKAIINFAKHNVSFVEAVTMFVDHEAFDSHDVLHSIGEHRRLRMGRSAAGRLLTVTYTFRRNENGEAIRIISARPASREEEIGYTGFQD